VTLHSALELVVHMPLLCRVSVLVGWLVAGAAVAGGADLVTWAPTLADAQKIAAEQNKLVLVHFHNDHCPPCERVEREVFSQPRVAESLVRNYVPVKVHAGAQPKIAEQFRVDRWPTDVICTPAGLEIMRTTSPQKADAYVGLIDQVALQTGVGTARQWQTSMQAAGQQVLDPQVAQAQAVAGQVAGAAQGYIQQGATAAQGYANQAATAAQGAANQANSTFQAYAAQANRWNQQAQATTQQAANTAQQLGNSAQQFGAVAQQAGQDLRSAWNGGGAGAVAGSAYAQFASPQAGPAGAATPATAPVVPSLPTANPFVSAGPSVVPPPAAVSQQPSSQPPLAPQNPAPQPPAGHPAIPQPTAAAGPPTSVLPPGPAPTAIPSAQSISALAGNPSPSLTPEQGLVPASQAPPIALEGYCPVTLLEQRKWKRSDPKFGAIHRGRTYLFASEAEQKKFLADPDAFTPVLSGYDPVAFAQRGEMVEGRRSYGLTYNKQIYLFADEASLQTFSKSPQAFADTARQAMIQAETGSRLR
jgi:YHS domain-containing protein/thiol-disulfide isomerase/thioredoxin